VFVTQRQAWLVEKKGTRMTFISIVASVMAGLVVNTARADFGNSWNLVLALDVINTVFVVFYLWRILREKSGPVQPKRKEL
jgi:hypothetical protein